ncbi:MAG: hypothetical protein M1838_005305 [Thelocarpon superellum]|nr:MAG: hypothetical protein M1838_005305 [Thelocarpon superellum]
MYAWLNGPGAVFRNPLPGSTNYLGAYDKFGRLQRAQQPADGESSDGGSKMATASASTTEEGQAGTSPIAPSSSSTLSSSSSSSSSSSPSSPSSSASADSAELPPEDARDLRPFPLNAMFRSQSVLDEDLRQEIYRRVKEQGKSVKVVSAELGVEMRRVGAVVRLKAVEEKWIQEGRKLATPYARAILSMLPRTPYQARYPVPHEPINDLPTHPATGTQIFWPTSESRVFTRTDAGRVFDPTLPLLPADERIPHPELIELERERAEGVPRDERIARARKRGEAEARDKLRRDERRKAREEREMLRVLPAEQGGKGGRWEWRVRRVNVEDVGADGRDPNGTGWRYGVPHEDRKRGQVKIPTSV